jgi:hypothetical protein
MFRKKKFLQKMRFALFDGTGIFIECLLDRKKLSFVALRTQLNRQ